MGLLDRAKKMAERAGPLIDKAAPHARTVVDKAGQQIDKRTGGKYHDKIEQVETKVGEYADKRMGTAGAAPAETGAADDVFPATPPPVTTPAPAPVDNADPVAVEPVGAERIDPTDSSAPVASSAADLEPDPDGPTATGNPGT